MSEPATNKRQTIDITEFERRLRGATPAAGTREDPLAELARLVSTDHDPFQSVFGAAPAPGRAVAAPAAAAPKREPRFEDFLDDTPAAPTARFAETRGTFDPNAEVHDGGTHAAGFDGQYADEESGPWIDDDAATGVADIDALEPQQRSNRALIFVAAGLVIVLGGIGGTFAFHRTGFLAGSPPTIVADATPVKVKPPASANAQDASAPAASVLDHGSSNGPTHVVNAVEQPIDFAQTPIAQRINVAGSSTDTSTGGPVSIFPVTKRVKTFSVRPDGTIIDGNGAPVQSGGAAAPQVATAAPGAGGPSVSASPLFAPATQPAPVAQTPVAQAPVVQAAPPAQAAPLPQARPSSLPVVASDPTSTIPTTAPATATRRQVVAAKTPPRVVAPKIEAAPIDSATPLQLNSAAAATPKTGVRSAKTSAAPDPFEIAAADDPAPVANAPAAPGTYGLQLAAPFTLNEANATWAKLQEKFPSELGSMQPSIRQADNKGHLFYRIRVGALSAQEANALCAKLKSDGGACFVTKN